MKTDDKKNVVQFKKNAWAETLNEWGARKSYYDDRIQFTLPLDLLDEITNIVVQLVSERMSQKKSLSYVDCILDVTTDIRFAHMEGSIEMKMYMLMTHILERMRGDKEIESLLEVDRSGLI